MIKVYLPYKILTFGVGEIGNKLIEHFDYF